jgi:UTP--glucose-1-phosphate uridylyltransferase
VFPEVKRAVIPAAGLGTRFLPATKAVPKEMLPIVDIPTIQLVIDEAVRAGITDVVVVNGRHKHAIEDHFDHAFELETTLEQRGKKALVEQLRKLAGMVRLISVRQKAPLGLGHAILCARESIGEHPFAVLLGDDLIDNDRDPGIAQLCRVYQQTGCGVVAVMEVPAGQEHLYGIVSGEAIASGAASGHVRIREMVEKPTPGTSPSRLAIVGRYVLPPAIWGHLAATAPGVGGEIQLTDALRQLAVGEPGLIGVVVEGVRHDAGDRLGYLRANLSYALKRAELRADVLAMLRQLLEEHG